MSGSSGRAVTVGAAAVVVGFGLFALRGQVGESASGPDQSPPPPARSTAPDGKADSLSSPPADVAEAKQTAGEFALALFRDDVSRMTQLATSEYADRLAEPTASGVSADDGPAGQVRIAAVQTEEFRGDFGLLQVLVERDVPAFDGSTEQQLQIVNVVVLRIDRGWRVDDASF